MNSVGTYSKILKVSSEGVYNGTKWSDDIAFVKESDIGAVLFSESVATRLGIKLANKKDQAKTDEKETETVKAK